MHQRRRNESATKQQVDSRMVNNSSTRISERNFVGSLCFFREYSASREDPDYLVRINARCPWNSTGRTSSATLLMTFVASHGQQLDLRPLDQWLIVVDRRSTCPSIYVTGLRYLHILIQACHIFGWIQAHNTACLTAVRSKTNASRGEAEMYQVAICHSADQGKRFSATFVAW